MIDYRTLVTGCAQDLIDSTEERGELGGNHEHYMEQLANDVLERANELAKGRWPRKCFKIEYDLSYTGGDYDKVGEFVHIPFDHFDLIPQRHPELQGKELEQVQQAFQDATEHDPIHIVSYNLDEPVTETGDEWEECDDCGRPLVTFMKDADGTNLEEVHGCPDCDS